MKKFLFLFLLFVSLYFIARVLLVWDKPNSEDKTRVSITIDRGSSLSAITKKLKEKFLIRDDLVFKLYVKWNKLSTKLQAGDYILQRNLTFKEIVEILQSGKSEELKITIPEGSTIAQIDDILARKSLIEAGEFKDCAATCNLGFRISNLEGYLFPSTYFVNPNTFNSKTFIKRLYKNFEIKIEPFKKDIKTSGHTLDEVVRIASMVEREAFGTGMIEKKKIAGIMWKRLEEHIPLGIDATTRYELNKWKEPLYTEDFESSSLYNTRKNAGLPPTAISNFSVDAFEASVYPIETEYYYYLHDCSGKIWFGETNDAHVENKYKVKLPGRDC